MFFGGAGDPVRTEMWQLNKEASYKKPLTSNEPNLQPTSLSPIAFFSTPIANLAGFLVLLGRRLAVDAPAALFWLQEQS